MLLLLMLGAIYAHWAIDDKLERSAPAMVFFFMLTCRMVVEWQINRRAAAASIAAANQTEAKTAKKTD